VAANGAEALEMLESDRYDGVLMDVQMPVMDGYTATREIRGRPGLRDLPVIAMTANAMAGDREKALEAGMNDHIAKPINMREMFTSMARWIRPSQPGAAVMQVRSCAPSDLDDAPLPEIEGLDRDAGLAIAQGNRDLYRKLLARFRDTQANFSDQFREARKGKDPDAPQRVAHTLKGVAANIGASAVQDAAKALESACRSGRPDSAIEALLAAVIDALEPLISGLVGLDSSVQPIAAAAHPADPALIREKIAHLRDLLEDSDADSTRALTELTALPGLSPFRPRIEALSRQIDDFDFEAALESLAALEAKLEMTDHG
jgi:polar amino acid transport system substrate-binding protein